MSWKPLAVGITLCPVVAGEGKRFAIAGAVDRGGCERAGRAPGEPLVWGGEQKLLASDAAELDQFGWSVSLASDGAATSLGALRREQRSRRGLRLRQERRRAGSRSRSWLPAMGPRATSFGSSVSLGTDRALVGAYGADALAARPTSSSRAATRGPRSRSWSRATGPRAKTSAASVSLAGDRALVGAYGSGAGAARPTSSSAAAAPGPRSRNSSRATGPRTTASAGPSRSPATARWWGHPGVTAFAAPPTSSSEAAADAWAEEQKLVANDGAAFDNFGNAVVARRRPRAGRAPLERRISRRRLRLRPKSGSSWTAEQKLVASDGAGQPVRQRRLARRRPRSHRGVRCDGRGAAYVFSRNAVTAAPGPRSRGSSRATRQADLFALVRLARRRSEPWSGPSTMTSFAARPTSFRSASRAATRAPPMPTRRRRRARTAVRSRLGLRARLVHPRGRVRERALRGRDLLRSDLRGERALPGGAQGLRRRRRVRAGESGCARRAVQVRRAMHERTVWRRRRLRRRDCAPMRVHLAGRVREWGGGERSGRRRRLRVPRGRPAGARPPAWLAVALVLLLLRRTRELRSQSPPLALACGASGREPE